MKIAALCNSLMGIPSLQSLAQSGRLAGIGMPDTEHDATFALRNLAPQLNIPLTVFSRQTFSDAAEKWLLHSGADLVLVYTFPFRVEEDLLSIPPMGFLNFHFGLLPQYRGADAIFWEIRNSEAFGAVTVHKMEYSLDTGPICIQQKVSIHPNDTYGIHMGNLAMTGLQVTQHLVSMMENKPESINWEPQDETLAKEWPRPGQREVLIDWNRMNAKEIIALVRACNPWNKGAYTFLGNNALRITIALNTSFPANGAPPGTLILNPEFGLLVACKDDQTILLETVFLDAGFFSGKELPALGITSGMRFTTPQL